MKAYTCKQGLGWERGQADVCDIISTLYHNRAERLRGERLKGISALPMELLMTYMYNNINLCASHDESLDPKGIRISLLQKLAKKEQGFGVYSQDYLGDHFM